MKTAVAVLVALAIASPARAQQSFDTQRWLEDLATRIPPIKQKPLTQEELSKPSKKIVEICWDDATDFPEDGKQPRDPFEDVTLFSCMLARGYQFCRECQSSWRGKCGRNRWAPHDPKCWESKMFPEVRSIGE